MKQQLHKLFNPDRHKDRHLDCFVVYNTLYNTLNDPYMCVNSPFSHSLPVSPSLSLSLSQDIGVVHCRGRKFCHLEQWACFSIYRPREAESQRGREGADLVQLERKTKEKGVI